MASNSPKDDRNINPRNRGIKEVAISALFAITHFVLFPLLFTIDIFIMGSRKILSRFEIFHDADESRPEQNDEEGREYEEHERK